MTDSNDAVILFDLKGNVQAWNRGAQKMYGWSETEALRMNFRDFVPEGGAAEHVDLMNRLLLGDAIASFETQRLTKDGRMLDVWLTATAMLDESGKVEAFSTTCRDITDRKRAQEELKSLNEALLERTAEAERRAEQLRKLAAELNLIEKREQQRIAQILHDSVQQALVAAKYRLALVASSQNVPQATAEVDNFINEAIAASRSLTTELNPPVLQQGGLKTMLEWLAQWMRDKHGLNVKVIVPGRNESLPENITFFLFRVIRELLFNVVKHSGAKAARVQASRLDEQIQIVIEDEGVGFDLNNLDLAAGSMGYGLSSIHERLTVLGGRMEIDSAPGKGSRFKLLIPC